ncbi:bifunctional (p)ppGpp synthetase/guanosine-3',5'-bis(diphosphate) 3'-pyrophosphohydrolase [Cognatishimia sp.]|uniref:RelA/SpoT family protein n=1 Tax=Cognatishimia sp. TaxID=2211648 RepID=UPI0035192C4F
MIPADDLVELVRAYNPKTNEQLIREAYDFGLAMHEGQFRHSGEPYFSHPIEVAAILTEQQLDDATIITALLHDTIEDTKASYQLVSDKFGDEVAMLVDGVTKLTNLQLSSTETKQAENFRKLFMAMSKDLRVILVKLADRLHNMRTIRAMKPHKQQQKARETMDIYAPLAGRMGMQWMREELEDLSFKVLNPDGRASIIRRFIMLQKETGDVIQRITGDMIGEFEKAGIDADVFGRAKKPYSIWRKMQEKEQSFSRLSDIYGFRIITRTEEDCYRALGAIHQRWAAVPGRFKDYISQPKSNGYRSIHTTVSGRNARRVEVQIRTKKMHDVAETGVAAHWSYRDGVRGENPFAVDPARWIRSLTEQFNIEEDHDEFMEAVKLEMYSDQVFCFTPKGDVVKLPRGATPIDFAYAIHTRIGNAIVGAKIDHMRVPLWTRVKNGQSIEIITAEGQTPQPTWLEIATTGKAKSAIRRALRDLDQERYIKLGFELARSAFERVGKKATEKVLDMAAKQLFQSSRDVMLAHLGSAQLNASEVVQAVYPELTPNNGEMVPASHAVIGLSDDQRFDRAPCCQPLPGERIVGITYRGKGVVVHAIDCENLVAFEDQAERWLDLHWEVGNHQPIYSATLKMTLSNDAGALGRICTLIGEQGVNISDLEFTDRKPDFFALEVHVELSDAEHLHTLLMTLQAESDIAAIERLRDPTRSAFAAAPKE